MCQPTRKRRRGSGGRRQGGIYLPFTQCTPHGLFFSQQPFQSHHYPKAVLNQVEITGELQPGVLSSPIRELCFWNHLACFFKAALQAEGPIRPYDEAMVGASYTLVFSTANVSGMETKTDKLLQMQETSWFLGFAVR